MVERGRALAGLGDFTEASESIAEAKKIEPGYIPAFALQSDIYLRLSQADFAIEQLGKAIAFAPSNTQLLSRRADLLLRAGRGDDAIADFAAVTRLQPLDPRAWGNLGAANLRFAHFEDALEMNARIESPPWVAHTQHDYARMLLARGAPGDRERALKMIERLRWIDSHHPALPDLRARASSLSAAPSGGVR